MSESKRPDEKGAARGRACGTDSLPLTAYSRPSRPLT